VSLLQTLVRLLVRPTGIEPAYGGLESTDNPSCPKAQNWCVWSSPLPSHGSTSRFSIN